MTLLLHVSFCDCSGVVGVGSAESLGDSAPIPRCGMCGSPITRFRGTLLLETLTAGEGGVGASFRRIQPSAED